MHLLSSLTLLSRNLLNPRISVAAVTMVSSSKGKPTDPKLKEKVTEEVKNETNKDGSGKGQMSAWKAAKIGKEYEKKGGDYENEAGSKNEPKKGEPEHKSDSKKEAETKAQDKEKADGEAEDSKPKAKAPKKAASKAGAPKKEKAAPRKGERRSTRVAQQKRSAPEEDKPASKKSKVAAK